MKEILLVALIFFSTRSAEAQRPSNVYIYSEDETQIDRQCGLNFESSRSAVAAIFRRNGYNIVNEESEIAMDVYLNFTTVLTNTGCAVHISFESSFHSTSRAPWGTNYRVKSVLCSQGSNLTGLNYNMQSRVRDDLVRFSEVCMNREVRARRNR